MSDRKELIKRDFGTAVQRMVTGQALVPFFFASLGLAVMGNALYQMLVDWVKLGWWSTGAIFVIGLVIVLAAAIVLWRFLCRLRLPELSVEKHSPKKRKGLIVLVSKAEVCRAAAKHHKDALRICWLVCSSATKGLADELREEFRAMGLDVQLRELEDVLDPLEAMRTVEGIYGSELPEGWMEDDVILDFTGMTACASVGSVLACLSEERPIQYTAAQYDDKLKPVGAVNPIEIVLHWGLLRAPEIEA